MASVTVGKVKLLLEEFAHVRVEGVDASVPCPIQQHEKVELSG